MLDKSTRSSQLAISASLLQVFLVGGRKKMLHHLSSLCLRGGCLCHAEEDAKNLLVRTAVKGSERMTHFFLFLTLITNTPAFIRLLIPLAAEKRSNIKKNHFCIHYTLIERMPAAIRLTLNSELPSASPTPLGKVRKTRWYQVGLSKIKAHPCKM